MQQRVEDDRRAAAGFENCSAHVWKKVDVN